MKNGREQEGFWVELQPLPPQVQQVVDAMHASGTDPQGSWTGIPEEAETPVQDADDL